MKETILWRTCTLVAVLWCSGLSPASADPEEVINVYISGDTSDIWLQLNKQCARVMKDVTRDEYPAYKAQFKAAAPILEYCYEGSYPSFLHLSGEEQATQFRKALSALPGPTDGAAATTAITTNGAVPALGGIAETLARGLAAILVKRAKAELQAFIIRKIQEDVCYKDGINGFLEHTCAYIGSSDGDFGVTLGPALRSAVITDVAALPERALAKTDAAGGAKALAARLMFTIAVSLVERADVKILANNLKLLVAQWKCAGGDADCSRLSASIDKATRALGIAVSIAEALRAAELQHRDGLPVAALDNLTKLAETGLEQVLSNAATKVDITEAQALAFRDTVRIAISTARAWLSADSQTRRNTSGQMLRSVVAIVELSLDLSGSIDASTMATVSRVSTDVASLVEAVAAADLAAVFTLTVTQLKRIKVPAGFDSAARVLALGVELAAGKTSDEVEATIEAVAAPMGGYRRKLFSTSRAIGGFVGANISWDNVDGAPTARSIGPTGLVGLDLTWHINNALAPGVFVSLFDLGAVFADQDKEGTSEPAPIQLEQLVALGLHGRISTKWSGPLVFHGGLAWVPNYRVVEGEERDVVRVLVGLSVDVTLFPF